LASIRKRGTDAKAEGHASVETKGGGAQVETHVRGLQPAFTFDLSRLTTHALWAVAPDLKVENLGELKIKNGSGIVASVTVLLQFALATAEPYSP
jgi:hypothetical protein